jgi:alpha-ribazole phosphatase
VRELRAVAAAVIVLARHGQSTTNATGLVVGRADPPLSELGQRQARALAGLLGDVATTWSSPLRRARETADLAAPGVAVEVRESFIEIDYGALEGRPLAEISASEWRDFETDQMARRGSGESLRSVDERVHAELDGLMGDPDSLLHEADRHLLIVTHFSPINSAVAWALGVAGPVTGRTRLDNGSLTTIGVRRGHPALVRFNVVPGLT